jgi:hypothetical protein
MYVLSIRNIFKDQRLFKALFIPSKESQHGLFSVSGTMMNIYPVPEHGTVSFCALARS